MATAWDRDPARIRQSAQKEQTVALCDPMLTSEILSNLLRNALLYSPPDRAVDVSVSQTLDYIVCQVEDRGGHVGRRD